MERWHDERNRLFAGTGPDDSRPRKFIGGAERARRDARRPKRPPPTDARVRRDNADGKRQKQKVQAHQLGLPKSLGPADRFMASLCLSNIDDLVSSTRSDPSRQHVLALICARAQVPVPKPIPAANQTAADFFKSRVSLVMEESRAILADALLRSSGPSSRSIDRSIRVRLVHVREAKKKNKSALVTLVFEAQNRSGSFTTRELYDMRPGSVYKIHLSSIASSNDSDNDSNGSSTAHRQAQQQQQLPILGWVAPSANRNEDGTHGVSADRVGLTIIPTTAFNDNVVHPNYRDEWRIEHVATLVAQQRQFDACVKAPTVPFMPQLVVAKTSKHTRFYSDDDNDNSDNLHEETVDGLSSFDSRRTNDHSNDCSSSQSDNHRNNKLASYFALPTLNAAQLKAMTDFVRSPDSTLSLVQGPPGTGKTTFLVSVIANLLIEHSRKRQHSNEELGHQQTKRNKRILVTAPTNKAVTVLASRFLQTMNADALISVVLIGVEDKLVEDTHSKDVEATKDPMLLPSSSPLRRIFVYSWLDTTWNDFRQLKNRTCRTSSINAELVSDATAFYNRVRTGIPHEGKASGLSKAALKLVMKLSERNANDLTTQTELADELDPLILDITESLERLHPISVVADLLASAQVIFCTLSTAGVSLMKSTVKVDDLLVDEAAATTEPELCIPFRLRPKRMLAVGDPMQLPALVVSQHAADMGLSRSLHQRLMMDCDGKHTMLDVQYRMRPGISSFPSKQFYRQKLNDGPNVKSGTSYISPLLGNRLFEGRPYTFLQCNGRESRNRGTSDSYSNAKEAALVVSLVKRIRQYSIARSGTNIDGCGKWSSKDRLRVITFYSGQVDLIRSMLGRAGLNDVLVATVDSSQGCEADVVLVSFVRSNDRSNVRRSAGFLDDARRINVALTRAKYQLICIGDALSTLRDSGSDTLKALVDDAERRKLIVLPG